MKWKYNQKKFIDWPGVRHRFIEIDVNAAARARLDCVLWDVATLRADARCASTKLKRWRRHALQRKGAGLHAVMSTQSDRVSLAMLDADGMVVCWYANGRARHGVDDHVVHRHFSQFYVAAVPIGNELDRHLSDAIANGAATHEGWRKRSDGSIFWGSTVIEPIMLRNGRLQGFSHVTRVVRQPSPASDVSANAVTRRAIRWPWFVTQAPVTQPPAVASMVQHEPSSTGTGPLLTDPVMR